MFVEFVYCNFLVLLSTTVCSQDINKQSVNIADKNLTDYSQGAETSCLCVCTKRVCVCNKELNSCTVGVYNT